MRPSINFDAKFRLVELPRWGLVVGGAAVMFLGQIALILLGSWLWGPAPGHEKPFANHSIGFQLLVTVVAMPFVETLIGQWIPIRLVSGALRQPWWLAGLASAIAFTCLHGYTDRAALSIFLRGGARRRVRYRGSTAWAASFEYLPCSRTGKRSRAGPAAPIALLWLRPLKGPLADCECPFGACSCVLASHARREWAPGSVVGRGLANNGPSTGLR
ncbi:hypothetical protein B0G73_112270 [Paraburkholderia sp. BL25I1N1]|nr:hypothetical protein B0G73_112270 [Paraburkholderia sp. BL25I1N1]